MRYLLLIVFLVAPLYSQTDTSLIVRGINYNVSQNSTNVYNLSRSLEGIHNKQSAKAAIQIVGGLGVWAFVVGSAIKSRSDWEERLERSYEKYGSSYDSKEDYLESLELYEPNHWSGLHTAGIIGGSALGICGIVNIPSSGRTRVNKTGAKKVLILVPWLVLGSVIVCIATLSQQ